MFPYSGEISQIAELLGSIGINLFGVTIGFCNTDPQRNGHSEK